MTGTEHKTSRPPEVGRPGLLASAWWMTGSHVVAQVFAYGSLIYLARLLPPAGFGTVAVGTALVYVLVLVVDRGTYGALVVHPRLTRADLVRSVRRCLLVAALLGVGMAAGSGMLVDLFADGGDAGAFALLAVCLPLHALGIVPTALIHKSMQFRRFAGVNAIANVGSAAVAVGIGLAGFGVWALAARQVVLFALLTVLAAVACRSELGRYGRVSGAVRPGPDTTGVAVTDAGLGPRTPVDRWFFLFGVTLVLTTNLDSLVVGNSGDAALAGLYALAFTIGMAPSTHFAEQVGKVLFAASAADPGSARLRTEQSVTLMSMVLVPLAPAGILVAPVVLPALLGPEWTSMVIGFQLLLVAGVGYGIANCIGEALSGNGHIAFRAKVMVVRCASTLVALWILVRIDDIRGAALAHLLVLVPYVAVYATAGARRAGTSARALARCLRPVGIALAGQLAVTAVVALVLHLAGTSPAVLLGGAAAAGLAVAVPLAWRVFRAFLRTRA